MSGKGVNTEKRADVPVIFFDKGIDLAVQMYAPFANINIHCIITPPLDAME